MPYDINAALQRLEENLNDLTSARTQVENVVSASDRLLHVVSEYVAHVNTLCTRLQKWEADLGEREDSLSRNIEGIISSLQSSCSQIVKAFNKSVEEQSSDFKNKTTAEIEKFSEENGKLASHVQEMNKLREEIKNSTENIKSIKESLIQISTDLKVSQDGQDAVLNDIKINVDNLTTNISNVIEKIETLNQNLNTGISSIEGKTDSISSEISKLSNTCQAIKNATGDIKSDINASTEKIANAILELKKEISKGININRWILIAAIILLAALQVVIK